MIRYEHFYVHTYIIYRDIYKYQVDIYLKQHHAHLHTNIHAAKRLSAGKAANYRGWTSAGLAVNLSEWTC